MTRPIKNRRISAHPGSVVYKPAGVPAKTLEWVELGLDEFESIRLLDYEGLDQLSAAEKMHVSRPTVTRIYSSARKKIAMAFTEGKAIRIEGGPVEFSMAKPEAAALKPAPMPGRFRRRRGMGRGRGGRHGQNRNNDL
ncbi:hypothetical protein SMSP2_00654 [Limihaloglobus sulfuriphilus]|uniref:UPF0251 protein SMSP2_00654 n=1 Tax=Limihaloglobus sulfuriphilus TaxID=1851148 RepID=A0A1Q2MCB8_9BACT|nr:DUF134 domain-containing protein [Limihaloglobus sulfuriphilus]AQQ70310.1 hypothetical protein SMSP2_00654 [Limihaloglobus sulfuriphilus]